jgi:hypothetical protein
MLSARHRVMSTGGYSRAQPRRACKAQGVGQSPFLPAAHQPSTRCRSFAINSELTHPEKTACTCEHVGGQANEQPSDPLSAIWRWRLRVHPPLYMPFMKCLTARPWPPERSTTSSSYRNSTCCPVPFTLGDPAFLPASRGRQPAAFLSGGPSLDSPLFKSAGGDCALQEHFLAAVVLRTLPEGGQQAFVSSRSSNSSPTRCASDPRHSTRRQRGSSARTGLRRSQWVVVR